MIKTVDRPYPGARPFQWADRDRFFGREVEAAAVAERWQTNHLTMVAGPAASGKTSLLHAGVYPLVAEADADVLPPGRVCYGATFPFAALPAHNPYTLALLRSWSPAETATRLVGLTVRDFIRHRADRHDGVIYAAIDQAEELLAEPGPRVALRRRFLGDLAEIVRHEPRLHLLLVVREEAVDLISETLGCGARYSVKALTREGAIAAVTGPVAGTGRSFAEGAAEKLVADLQKNRIAAANGTKREITGKYVEPSLLQVVCASLWDSLPADADLITARDVRRYGDADATLASHCGRVVAAVADDHDLSAAALRTWLRDTFITDHGTRGNAYEGQTATRDMPNAVVRALEDHHLLRAELRSGSRWYELLSDRLIEPLRKAADERPPLTEPAEYLRRAGRAMALGELDLAERYAEETVRTAPDTDLRLRAEADSLLGNLAYERDMPEAAEARYRSAASLFEAVPDTAAAARQLAAVGQTLLTQGRPADAVTELRAAVCRMPNEPVLQTGLSLALWQLGDGGGAVAILNDVLGVDGGNTEALRVRGEILADLGDGREAMRDLDRVALQDRPSTRAARGLALAELGEQAAASREIKDALDEAPRNGPVLLYSARATELGGDPITAADLARRAVDAMDPALPPQQLQVALQLAGQKRRA